MEFELICSGLLGTTGRGRGGLPSPELVPHIGESFFPELGGGGSKAGLQMAPQDLHQYPKWSGFALEKCFFEISLDPEMATFQAFWEHLGGQRGSSRGPKRAGISVGGGSFLEKCVFDPPPVFFAPA